MGDAEPEGSGDGLPRKRILAACEACRDNKIRCRPSEKPGVCRKCLASKRECIVRTKPRVRRMVIEQNLVPEAIPQPATGPSKSFSIDFAIPLKVEVEDSFQSLRDAHANFFDSLVFPGDGSGLSEHNTSMHSVYSTPTSTTDAEPIPDLHAKPSFNLASAESLLTSFHTMLCHFPCIVLSPDISVSLLASTQPFVLLAILAAASGSRIIQSNSLYDEEFRKILGLKFVACGERTVEILQGILIYCAWYPFHLRPRSKQPFRYIRMAAEIIHELELDQETRVDLQYTDARLTSQQLHSIRAYLGYFYLASTIPAEWQSRGNKPPVFTNWTESCCKILERSNVDNDIVLASLVRLSSTATEALRAINDDNSHTHQQSRLVLLGLEAQLRDIESLIPPHIASTPVVYMQNLFVHLSMQDGALLRLPRLSPHLIKGRPPLPPEASQLYASVDTIQKLLNYILSLDEATMARFSTADWCRFISGIILAIRLSLAIPECPDFDTSWCGKKIDVLSAMRTVMRIVKDKYTQRLFILEHGHGMTAPKLSLGCPMLDGSMDKQFQLWQSVVDAEIPTTALPGGDIATAFSADDDMILQDLWATTAGWANGDALPEW
ncbi:hypothetical protein TrVFT333_011849 [Trichoderma virens FT-333]|nr:hypothetical protein TrVFT333_011849 [Trichoderma virens FT-333]